MKQPLFEIWRSDDGLWRWHLKARNGEIQGCGEGYKRTSGALAGIDAFKRNAKTAEIKVLK